MSTPDERVAIEMARHVDGKKFRLLEELGILMKAQTRIAEIQAELAVYDMEKERLEPRLPREPEPPPPREDPPIEPTRAPTRSA